MLLRAKNILDSANNYDIIALCTEVVLEQLNKIKVDDGWITPMEKFSDIKTDITLKIITHGDVQFVSLMKYYKARYLGCPSGNPSHMQVSILVTQYFMQDK